MFVNAFRRSATVLALLVLAACHHRPFLAAKFASNEELYRASLHELTRHHWDNAVSGFERLTTELPARDPLLPLAYFYLGKAHEGRHEYILAAQAFSRIPESFPEDTLAPVATLEAGLAYAKLWRRPALDADYGRTALSTLQSFMAAYPDSPLRERAQREIDRLTEWLAQKDYDTGMFYFRRKAYDPAIIYFKDVARLYPGTHHARLALLKLVESYQKINYKEEVAETCSTLREKYPDDAEVTKTCGTAPVASNGKSEKP